MHPGAAWALKGAAPAAPSGCLSGPLQRNGEG